MHRVVARIGPEAGGTVHRMRLFSQGEELAVEELKVGTGVRHGACLPSGQVLEVSARADGRNGRLLASFASGSARATYLVEAQVAGKRELLDTVILPAGEAGWVDRTFHLTKFQSLAESFRIRAASSNPSLDPCVGGLVVSEADSGSRPPNVVLISLDTLGRDYLGPDETGRSLTPNLDRLRGESFVFDRAYAQYPSTLGSHSSLFSGLYPGHHRRFDRLSEPLVSLVGPFARSGWLAAGVTENAFVGSSFGFATAFDEYDDGASRARGDAPRTFRRAQDWLEQRGVNERFFLFVHTYEVHEPYRPRDQQSRAMADSLSPGDTRLWDDGEQYRMMRKHPNRERLPRKDVERLEALHKGEIEYLDRALADFLRTLDRLGLAENTIVVLFSDHGEEFLMDGPLGHGVTLRNKVLRVPLYFRWPARLAAGASSNPVEVADILPTLLDLAGLPIPAPLDGSSLLPQMAPGVANDPSDHAWAELVLDAGECTVEGRVLSPCTFRGETLIGSRWKLFRSGKKESTRIIKLFDLESDPAELEDVSAEHPEIVERMVVEMDRRAAGEPARAGAVGGELDEVTRRRLEALGYVQ